MESNSAVQKAENSENNTKHHTLKNQVAIAT